VCDQSSAAILCRDKLDKTKTPRLTLMLKCKPHQQTVPEAESGFTKAPIKIGAFDFSALLRK
jgi:hypothetical protein